MEESGTLRELARFLVGATEIAEQLEVHPNTINTWKARAIGFPPPLKRLHGLDLWDQREVLEWARRTKRYPPHRRSHPDK